MRPTRSATALFLIAAVLAMPAWLGGPGASALTPGSPAPGTPLHIHIISGSREYPSAPALRAFKAHLEAHYNVRCTASWGHDGIEELPDLAPLKDAELLIIFARRMKLGDGQMALIRRHWEQGKPIVSLRTSSHAFSNEVNAVFDRQVMGGNYQGHFGDEGVQVTAADGADDHPVLAGVKPFTSTKLYKAGDLRDDVIVLQHGDNGKAKHAVTWTRVHNGGRVLYSSLGVPTDFEDESFRRMLLNAVFWTTKRDAAAMRK